MDTAPSTVSIPLPFCPRCGYITAMSTLGQRIRYRLGVLQKTARAASRETGRGPDVIRNILRAEEEGREYSPRVDTLEAVAKALRTSPEWLLTGEGVEDIEDKSRAWYPSESALFGAPDWIELAGIVEVNAFRDNVFAEGVRHKEVPIAPDPRFAHAKQHAWLVNDDSMDLAGIYKGMYVVAVDWISYVRHYGHTRDRQLLVVARVLERGANPGKYEYSIKEFRVREHEGILAPEYHTRSSNPAYKSIIAHEPTSAEAFSASGGYERATGPVTEYRRPQTEQPGKTELVLRVGLVVSAIRLFTDWTGEPDAREQLPSAG